MIACDRELRFASVAAASRLQFGYSRFGISRALRALRPRGSGRGFVLADGVADIHEHGSDKPVGPDADAPRAIVGTRDAAGHTQEVGRSVIPTGCVSILPVACSSADNTT